MIDGVRAENDSAHAIIRLWGFVHKAFTLMRRSRVPRQHATVFSGC